MDNLVGAQDVCGGYASPGRAYVKGFRELNKLCSGAVGSTQEDGHLQPDPGRAPLLAILQLLAFLGILCSQWDIPVVLAH